MHCDSRYTAHKSAGTRSAWMLGYARDRHINLVGIRWVVYLL